MIKFPSVECANEQGLLAIGGDLEVETLICAYTSGIFPWPIDERFPLTWFAPDPRGILFVKDFHISRSMKKILKKSTYKVTVNQNFHLIIKECANASNRQSDGEYEKKNKTWITQEMIDAYIKLFKAGYAYSIEVYESDNKSDKELLLVGGLYGVVIGGMFTGESMFYSKNNASKIALIYLMERLSNIGVEWIDIQMVTPTLKSFGGKEILRSEFMSLLKEALKKSHQLKNIIN
ncbi:MAG: leucyl/phenylalanyl-tRNA--protein transferase [Oligoflexia bacterium]|nr:leucyl/phenylalanyl-tRNA--protein transferase [Oligoflexia bacterium]